jgi:hypothetical protein
MGRHDQAGLPLFQKSQVVERSNILRAAPEIEQERMTALDRALHPGNQNDPAVGGVPGKRTDVELPFVERDRQRVIAKRCRAIDQLRQRVWNPIDRVIRRVGVELLSGRARDPSIGGCNYQSECDLLRLTDPITFVMGTAGVSRVSDFLVAHGGKLFLQRSGLRDRKCRFDYSCSGRLVAKIRHHIS